MPYMDMHMFYLPYMDTLILNSFLKCCTPANRPFELPASKPDKGTLPSLPGGIHRAVSYEDFKKQRDLQLGGRSLVGSDASSMRRARSEGDVAIQSLKKKAEVPAQVLCWPFFFKFIYLFLF